MKKYDVIIVGAGITGCSISYFLTQYGINDILVIDKNGIANGITGICPGGVRQQWGTAINCQMSKASTDFYASINDYLKSDNEIMFRNVGYLYTFHSEEAIDNYKGSIKIQNKHGIPTKLISPQDAKEIIPGINEESFLAASYCETDGFADDAYHVAHSFANTAKKAGATFINDEVIEITSENGRVTGVKTKKNGSIYSEKVVNAAGLFSKELAATIGVQLPIEKETRRILYTNRISERVLEPLLVSFEKGFAAKQLTDGTIYLSYLGKDFQPPYNMFEFQLRAAEVGTKIFPPLETVEFRTHLDGQYDSTPDHQAILGNMDEVEGYYQAVGMSGHGFMMAPAIGRSMAELVTGKPPFIDIECLNYRRFKKNELIYEPSIV